MCPHTHPLLANVSGMEVEHVRLAHIRKSNTPTYQGQRERRTECDTAASSHLPLPYFKSPAEGPGRDQREGNEQYLAPSKASAQEVSPDLGWGYLLDSSACRPHSPPEASADSGEPGSNALASKEVCCGGEARGGFN